MSDLQWGGLDAGVAGNKKAGMPSLARRYADGDNQKFKFPGDTRRDFESGEEYKVQRGFMRSLLGEMHDLKDKDIIKNARFFFQFNPERIMRSVSVSSGLMNPLLQDPGQFSIATPGNATFSFDILLNREMEVNQASQVVRNTTFDEVATGAFNLPGRIGVLSDLLVMDGIIGQGINSNTIDALAKLQSISSSWDTSDTSSGASAGGTTGNFIAVDKAKDAFASIMGNSAFLVSTPVRIVFSELFMVDGFIQGSSVNFTKFSKDMIPTMCAINITVEAKYIGFAKKDTYLTKSLQSAKENEGVVTTPETTVEGPGSQVLRDAIKELANYQVAVGGVDAQSHPETWGSNETGTGNDHYSTLWRILDYSVFLLRAGFTDGEDAHDKGIGKLFYEGKYKLTFTHQPTIRVWRSFASGEKNQAQLNNKITNTGFAQGDGSVMIDGGNKVNRDVLLLLIQGATATCTDYNSWKKYKSYGGGGRTSDKAYDNHSNTIFVDGKKDSSLARNLYLIGGNTKGNHTNDNHLMLEVDLTITATIITPGVAYSPQYSKFTPEPVTSSIIFTQKLLSSMDSKDIVFKRFKVVEKKAK